MSASPHDLLREAETRLERLAADAKDGALEPAIALLVHSLRAGGVIQAFGTGHSEAFAMEIAGRAGGLIPTNRIALRDIVLHGARSADVLTGSLEREPWVVDELMAVSPVTENDVFVIASNSGVNGSIVGVALWAKEHGHPVIAVTSLEHTARVEPKHPSGKRLSEIADVVIDNLAPYGDSTLQRHRRDLGRRDLLDHGGVHRPAAHPRRRPHHGRGRRGSADVHLGQHPRRRRAQLGARGPLPRSAPPRRLSRPTDSSLSLTPSLGRQESHGNQRRFHQPALVAARCGARGGHGASRRQPGILRGPGRRQQHAVRTGAVSADNPFGVAANSKVDAVIFDGGYGVDYVENAARSWTRSRAAPRSRSPPPPRSRRSCSRASSAATRRT